MGPRTDSSCCCQARNLSWAPVPPPHAAARPVICHGPPYRLLMLLPRPVICHGPCTPPPHAAARSRVCHGSPVRPSHCCCPPSPHSAMCHFQVSSHCWWFHFVIGCCRLRASPIAAARPVICHGPPYRLLMLLAK
ncbi:unnamed protein product, partial [Staurois parvus]